MRTRRHLADPFIAAAAAILLQVACADAPSPLPRIDNVVLVSLDTLRPDHLSYYGYGRPTSPNLDALARQSYVFESAFASSPNTPPSQMSMMTSLYPGRHGFTGKDDRLANEHATLAMHLEQAGLRTAGFVDGGYLRASFGFDRGFDVYNDKGGGLAKILPLALRWLDHHDAAPFFLFLHTYDIHSPYKPPPPYRGMFHDVPYTGDRPASGLGRVVRGEVEIDEDDVRHLVDSYDEGIRYTDDQLLPLLEFLRSKPYFERTAIIVTSDHGEEFMEHGSLLHWQLYARPNLQVPLIVSLPGGVSHRIEQPVELIDLAPTILELVGATPIEAAQGKSLVPLMRSASDSAASRLRSTHDRGLFAWAAHPLKSPLRSIVRGDYQLLFKEDESRGGKLFDLVDDTFAQRDIAAENLEIVDSMREAAMITMRANRAAPTPSASPLDSETTDQLRALGYLDAAGD